LGLLDLELVIEDWLLVNGRRFAGFPAWPRFSGAFGRDNGLSQNAAKLATFVHQDGDPPGRKQPRQHDEFEPAAGFDQFLQGDIVYLTNDPCSMTNFQSFESRKSCPRQRRAKKSEMRPGSDLL